MDIIIFFKTVITGIGATLVMDLWSLCQKLILKIPPLNYALVGRWILWLPQGKFRHHTIFSVTDTWGESYWLGIPLSDRDNFCCYPAFA